MGTRSITHIYEMDSLQSKDNDRLVCSFYRHWDGYLDGHGADLKEWLDGKRLVNGIGSDFVEGVDHNRAGQMAIELMYALKKKTSIECVPTNEEATEEYTYYLRYNEKDGFRIKVVCYGRHWEGRINDFDPDTIEAGWEAAEDQI